MWQSRSAPRWQVNDVACSDAEDPVSVAVDREGDAARSFRFERLPPPTTADIEELTATLDMGDFIDRRTDGFSQGQRVKVAIARAVVHRPQTVLLDEPSNGLDVMSTRALRNYVRGLREAGLWLIGALAMVLLIALVFVLANLLVDISYAYLDPRIHYE